MKKDWTEDIRKKMESYEHPAPEMVWSNVELPIIAKGKKESSYNISYRAYCYIAIIH